MRRLQRSAAILLLLALSGLPSALAAQEVSGRTITGIEVSGLQSLAEETLLFYLGLEVGARLDMAELNRKLHELWSRQLLEDINVEALPDGDGVVVRIQVSERPVLRSIDYQGLKRINRGQITERISQDRIRVREGDALSRGELYRLKSAIEELYREKGFRLARADYTLEQVDVGEYRVLFTIDEGDKVRIGDIDFEGNTVFRDIRLRWAMKKTKESNLINRILKKDIYNPATLQEDLQKVAGLYRDAGYKNISLGEPQIEVVSKKKQPAAPADKKRRLAIIIPVEEGQRWKLGDIEIEGNEKFPDELLRSVFRKPRGGWLRASVIDKAVEQIGELYSNSGYLFAQVETELREREDNVADVLVHVDEGDQFKVGRIEFEGNTRTRDKVLRRELRVQEGLVLNAGALRNSLRRIGQLEYFKVDEEDPVAFDFNDMEKTVDVVVKGEEGDRTELQLGGGWSEIDGFFGQFAVRTRNFLGRGETVGVSVQTGRFRNLFDLSYFAPWFLDRPQSAGVQIFQRDLDFSLLSGQTFFQESRGATLTYGRNLGLFKSISFSYSRFDAEDRRRLVAADGTLIDQEFSRDVSSLRGSWVFNSIDSRFNPTVGTRLTGSLEVAGGPLGGSTSFVRPQAAFTLFRPVTKQPTPTVFSVNAEAGWIRPYDDQELFFLDRYFMGGENSIRGFRFRSIWVRDEDGRTVIDDDGFPLGGDKFLQVNVEYHVLLGGPFRILGFVDAGNVFGEDQAFDLSQLRYTAGLELRLFVPVLGQPLRFIWARNLDSLEDDRFESFQFSIGAGF